MTTFRFGRAVLLWRCISTGKQCSTGICAGTRNTISCGRPCGTFQGARTTKPRTMAGLQRASGACRRSSLRSRGTLCLAAGGSRPGIANSRPITLGRLAPQTSPRYPATVWTQDALGRGATQLPTRGSSQGSRYSRLGATRKGEKATAGQAQIPRQGAVTVSKPTNRHTPRRAGGASTHNPESVERLLGVGAGRPGKPHCVESWRSRFSACRARGSHASGSGQDRAPASLACALACASERA